MPFGKIFENILWRMQKFHLSQRRKIFANQQSGTSAQNDNCAAAQKKAAFANAKTSPFIKLPQFTQQTS